MEKDNVIKAFSNLSVDNKRKIYNQEMIETFEILKNFFEVNLNDYKYKENNYFDEEQFLNTEFENLLTLRELIIYILSIRK